MTVPAGIEVPVWRRIDSLPLMGFTGLVAVIPMLGLTLVAILINLAGANPLFSYPFAAAGTMSFVALVSVRAVEILRTPHRIGYTSHALVLDYGGKKGEKNVPFRALARLEVAKYASGWYVDFETATGEREILGPGISVGYGEGLMKAFILSRESEVGEQRTLREQRGIYPSVRLVAIGS